MSEEIKSAWEIAQEKLKSIKVSKEELNRDAYFEEGKKIAARFLKEEGFGIKESLGNYPDKVKNFVREGMEFVLLHNIILPSDEKSHRDAFIALEGALLLKKDKNVTLKIHKGIKDLLESYIVEKQENFERLKSAFGLRLERTRKAVESQLGMKVNIDAENQPEFQKEWRTLLAQLDFEYTRVLEDFKEKLRKIH